MRTLDRTNIGIRGGWRFHVEATGVWVTGPTYNDLLGEIRKHCKANAVAGPSEAEVQDQICEWAPEGYCLEESGSPVLNRDLSAHFSLDEIKSFTGSMLSWLNSGFERAPKELANARAAVCRACKLNHPIEGCAGCAKKGLLTLISGFVGSGRTNHDDFLGVCHACGCALRAKIWLPKAILWKNMSEAQKNRLHEACWLLEE